MWNNCRCESYKTVDDCLGILGCQWCKFDSDGQTLLVNPSCVSTDQCFGGTKGRRIRGSVFILSQFSIVVNISLIIIAFTFKFRILRTMQFSFICFSGFLESESQLVAHWSVGAPVGPVAAGIMSVFLIMVFFSLNFQ